MASQTKLRLAFHLMAFSAAFAVLSSAAEDPSVRARIMHRDSAAVAGSSATMSGIERVKKAVQRSKARARRLDAYVKAASATYSTLSEDTGSFRSAISVGNAEYLMSLSIGTPPIPFQAVMDTGSDLIWTECHPCKQCVNQSTPVYNPTVSWSFARESCEGSFCKALYNAMCSPNDTCQYYYAYEDSSSTSGILGYETLTLGQKQLKTRIAFGCGTRNDISGDAAGLVGMGRGKLSLMSQMYGSTTSNMFAYCLQSDPKAQSALIIGPEAKVAMGTAKMVTTSLVVNPVVPTFYYVEVQSIHVGGHDVDIPDGAFSLTPQGTGGLIVDSGTTVTVLPERVYYEIKEELSSAVALDTVDGSAEGLDLCFSKLSQESGKPLFPEIVMNLKGNASLVWTSDHYLLGIPKKNMICLAMVPNTGLGISIIGNIAQADHYFLFDSSQNTLSFAPYNCSSL